MPWFCWNGLCRLSFQNPLLQSTQVEATWAVSCTVIGEVPSPHFNVPRVTTISHFKSISSEKFGGLWCHFQLVKVIPIYKGPASVEDMCSWFIFISKNNEHPCPNYQHRIFFSAPENSPSFPGLAWTSLVNLCWALPCRWTNIQGQKIRGNCPMGLYWE